ncbi:MAG: CheB methylesterase domain-containing protein [Defluviitaleaceae bacterium]|nr:CheB methylesterase domain-containing protein [Defluviitaleaceae bacterium]
MQANVMILTADLTLKAFLSSMLAKEGFLVNIKVNSIFGVQAAMDIGKANVLVLDTDTTVAMPAAIKFLADIKNLSTILLGIKNSAPYQIAGIKGALSKPDGDTEFVRRIFVRNILDRIELFMRNASPRGIANITAAAGVDEKIIAIAASTGGTDALHTVLTGLPAQVPPILIVQHMPSMFTYQFATRLNLAVRFTVKEAAMNDMAKKNVALIAPGDYHMKAVMRDKKLLLECFQGEKMHGVRPAADILFDTMADFTGRNVIGVVLTGMGADGARGLMKLKKKGATIIGQDKESSVVYGMPKAAYDLGIVDYQLPLNQIANKIAELV